MSNNLSHLNENARSVIESSDCDRIRHIRQPCWVPYPRAKQILGLFDDLLTRPTVPRSPCYILIGATNNGKTALLSRFIESHPFEEDGRGSGHRKVFFISAPPVADERRFYSAILNAVDIYTPRQDIINAQGMVIRLLRSLGVRILLIDEIQHFVATGPVRSRQMMNVLKYMSNDLEISIVGAGVYTAYHSLQSDPQMANRFKALELPRWELNQEFLQLLISFERFLPLKEASCLTEKSMALRLFGLIDGKIGELASLLADAAVHAIRCGHERITPEILDQIDWIIPGEKRATVN